METKHTPGPWVAKHLSGSNFAVQRFEIRSGAGLPMPIFQKDTSAIDCASVCLSPHDANLIAAAPELLSIAMRWIALESQWHPDRYENEKAQLLLETKALITSTNA
ncbi:hypothetical protein BOW65_09590 [Pseudomonas koreensis]|uniref:hypothetical protein n=1 Tax=Pseudomonas koreensis TaxID=198620 RepID=UPI0009877984|nr:hypothetical protein [Pseudomonas koreensis]OOH81324.1 hypothetical protein BOW65_09590 [Pseudomonas koreensis]